MAQPAYQLVTDGKTLDSSENFTGKAVATYPNGDVYDGDFVAGKRVSKSGKYTYATVPNPEGEKPPSDEYTGEWVDNERHGIGMMVYQGQGTYHGYWANGQKCGEGVMKYLNGDIYSGNWKAGKKDGQGTYIFEETKMKFIGKFRAGEMVEGQWIYPNNSYFEGKFENCQPKGQGKWCFANGNKVEGVYSQTRTVEGAGDLKLSWKTTGNLKAQ